MFASRMLCLSLVGAAQVWDTVSPRMSGKALEWLRTNTKPIGATGSAGAGGSGANGAKEAMKEGERATAGASA